MLQVPTAVSTHAQARRCGLTTASSVRLPGRHASTVTRRQVAPQATAANNLSSLEVVVDASRRTLLMGCVGAAVLSTNGMSRADEEYLLFKGMASPPTSYGGYGGNANEAPKYTFEYPTGWKEEKTSKVEKGTQGIDGRVSNPKVKGQGAYVITLGRAGEDDKSFQLTNLESTFSSFAGADYQLQDALQDATNTELSESKTDGINFYRYDIDSPDFRYLSSIAVKNGKVFALFVRTPTRSFKAAEGKLRHIIDTFRLL